LSVETITSISTERNFAEIKTSQDFSRLLYARDVKSFEVGIPGAFAERVVIITDLSNKNIIN
jgi:hypothetical protein